MRHIISGSGEGIIKTKNTSLKTLKNLSQITFANNLLTNGLVQFHFSALGTVYCFHINQLNVD